MRKTITIRLDNGKTDQISAESRGEYAIHPTSVHKETGWTVTHIKSGMAIIDQLATRKIAREFLMEFKKMAIDCNVFASGTPEESLTPKQRADKKEIRQLILRYRG